MLKRYFRSSDEERERVGGGREGGREGVSLVVVVLVALLLLLLQVVAVVVAVAVVVVVVVVYCLCVCVCGGGAGWLLPPASALRDRAERG